MDSAAASPPMQPGDDLSPLAWVNGELRRSLEAANKALRRYLKEAEAARGGDLDAVDPAVLRSARAQLHQGVGALELVGLPAVADVLRGSEAAVQRMAAKPQLVTSAAIDTVEKVSFAVLDFLARQLAGKPVSPVMLFPQYRAVQQLAGADRVHPADLWKADWQWRELPHDAAATPRNADEAARDEMETLTLALMRQAPGDQSRGALDRLSDLCADLGAGARLSAEGGSQRATFWQLAAAVFQAQAAGLLVGDVYVKRLASRLLSQLRAAVRGQHELSDRLAQDLLFFCGHAKPPMEGRAAPRLSAVRQVWQLDGQGAAADYETTRLGRFDPALVALARKRVAAAKDSWSAVAGGELHRMPALPEQFALVGESLQRLLPHGEELSQSLQTAVATTVNSGEPPSPALAMEVATGILYLDATLEDGEFDDPELPARVQHLAGRVEGVRQGAEPRPLDVWMEELYRRVSDRQTMGSVVQELRSSLSEIEKQIDQYFRDPSQRQVLIPVPAQLSAMRGVLSVLGLGQASAAALRMRDDVDALAQTEVDPQRAVQAGTFDRLADNLGALSFLIDMLSVQPALAKSLFRFDPDTGSLSAVMGQSERVSAFAAFDEADAPAPASPPPPPAAVPLLDQLREVAALAADAAVADSRIASRLEPLAQQAYAAEQPELARLLSGARVALQAGDDAEASAAVRAQLAEAVEALSPPAAPPAPVSAPVPPPKPAPAGGTGLEEDEEMRDIFIEEAREVISDAHAALERLVDAPESAHDLTAVRRAFHTLKGSSRMVGLKDFGEAGWACEQLYNDRLAQAPRMDAPLRQFTGEALAYLAGWVEAIAVNEDHGHNAPAVARAAEALRLQGEQVTIPLPQAPAGSAVQAPVPAAVLPVPAAAEGVFEFSGLDAELAPSPPPPEASVGELIELSFDPEEDASAELATEAPAEAAAQAEEAPAAAPDLPSEPAALDAPPAELPDGLAPDVPSPLQLRVPDLPSAADLDLGGEPELAAASPAQPAAEALLPSFELDLGALGEAEPGPVPLPVDPQALPELLLDEPLPADAAEADAPETLPEAMPEGEALEMDLADLDALFAEPAGGEAAALVVEGLGEPEAASVIEPLAGSVSEPAEASADIPALDTTAPDEPAPHEAAEMPATDAVEIDFEPPVLSLVEAPAAPAPAEAANDATADEDEQVKVIGPLRISIPLFNIYLNEADELSRRLVTELAEWALESERHAVPDSSVALAHSLAGSSATVGYAELSALARALEHALMRSHDVGHAREGEPALFCDAADEIRRLLHQFAAGFLRPVAPALMERLAAHERLPLPPETAESLEPEDLHEDEPAAPSPAEAPISADIEDAIDAELLPIFEEEAEELLPQLQSRLRDWLDRPDDADAPMACMRTLHTLKGGARLAGAMRMGELAHRLETDIEHLVARGGVSAADVDPLMARADAMSELFERLRAGPAPAAVPAAALPAVAEAAVAALAPPAPEEAGLDLDFDLPAEAVPAEAAASPPADEALDLDFEEDAAPAPAAAPLDGPTVEAPPLAVAAPLEPVEPVAPPPPAPEIDWQRFSLGDSAEAAGADRVTASNAVVRVRASLLDRLVNQAGEVSITRARIDADVRQLQASLNDLTDSLDRMRKQLRDIELQAETQIATRIEAAKAASQSFDPLEMDRFTRFQELTRFMAESVNDVATLQRSLQRTLQSSEDELAAQARLTRELQDDLLRTRMVEFDSMAERLQRTTRQAARETGRQARLEIVGGAIEIDRGVLERMAGSFEHLLRNSVAHGIEAPAVRSAAGKDATGLITVAVAQAGNEVAVEFADDGGGLDLGRIRQRALERGLLPEGAAVNDAELAQMIFKPGFSTAETVTEIAGRGVGLDVVRAEVNAMGGRIETQSQPGAGTRFKLLLPLTTAVTQVVMLRCGEQQVAVPSPLIETVRRVPNEEVARAYADLTLSYADEAVPFFWLGALLRSGGRGETPGRTQTVVVIRSAAQRVAVHVDEVMGNQEVVVKNVGPQLSRLPGLAGVTLLPSGEVSLIYNPVALASLYGDEARAAMQQAIARPASPVPGGTPPVGAAPVPAVPEMPRTPMVMVVDDSITVRRVTQRLLVREGYRVVTAKDGLDALERLAEERPAVLLSDIEMPRMDGFDLLRNVRADARLAGLPVVMITSRTAQKHRDYAEQLGVDHYLGKPYSEDELLGLVARYAGSRMPA
ncbi:hybrid sensor histidine kinase/response regulator [Rubrivivax rivuli]|uniref:Chemotaxis protein CheA n=1 Tax=Rubrivivax rivuli TaxID=1862385 RepID=A0A437RLP7_9BURK|nr:Hpt domain-containing protein [Rubrivivax rivuli]RVU47728.1 hybrid sensor histidine kinase/response regulator [Rubrivivax rivuli]